MNGNFHKFTDMRTRTGQRTPWDLRRFEFLYETCRKVLPGFPPYDQPAKWRDGTEPQQKATFKQMIENWVWIFSELRDEEQLQTWKNSWLQQANGTQNAMRSFHLIVPLVTGAGGSSSSAQGGVLGPVVLDSQRESLLYDTVWRRSLLFHQKLAGDIAAVDTGVADLGAQLQKQCDHIDANTVKMLSKHRDRIGAEKLLEAFGNAGGTMNQLARALDAMGLTLLSSRVRAYTQKGAS